MTGKVTFTVEEYHGQTKTTFVLTNGNELSSLNIRQPEVITDIANIAKQLTRYEKAFLVDILQELR